jgi:hypothetical protein
VKPPIGLRPKMIAVSSRVHEIHEAMTRYIDANYLIPKEWLEEYMNILDTYYGDIKEDKKYEV